MKSIDKEKAIQRIEEIEREARELRKIIETPDKVAPWEPEQGNYLCMGDGQTCCEGHRKTIEEYTLAGASWSTKKEAEEAGARNVFRQRLDRLAAELNPSKKLSKKYYCFYDDVDKKWFYGASPGGMASRVFLDAIFETKEAVEKAIEIMNRDGWQPPEYMIR